MAPSLRKRLGRTFEVKAAVYDGAPNTNCDSVDESTSKLIYSRHQQPMAKDDLSNTPPLPERKLRSHGGLSTRNLSPSQALLNRYKNRAPVTQVITTSPDIAEQNGHARPAARETSFGEHFNIDSSMPCAGSMGRPHAANNDILEEDADEFNFGLTGKKCKAAEGPVITSEGNDMLSLQGPRTRSQKRREERADSSDAGVEIRDFPKSNIIPSLTIRKKSARLAALKTPPLSPVHKDGNVESEVLPIPAKSPRRESTPTLIERAKGPLVRLSPSPDHATGTPTFTFRRKSKPTPTASQEIDLTIAVIPPPFDPVKPIGQIWTSPFVSTSRPSEPWGWLKSWTCCQCEGLDPIGRGSAAQTMVEQKVCSRLDCGHVRCVLGCRVVRDRRFDQPGIFAMR